MIPGCVGIVLIGIVMDCICKQKQQKQKQSNKTERYSNEDMVNDIAEVQPLNASDGYVHVMDADYGARATTTQ